MPKSYKHLDLGKRAEIYALLQIGTKISDIAKHIGCHVSTVRRELSRNAGQKGYRYKQANSKATERRSAASRIPKKITPEIKNLIILHIRQEWSPEQIAGRLRKEAVVDVSHETIYKLIRADKKSGGDLYKHLRHRGKKYNKLSPATAGRGCIPNRVDISKRPPEVELKATVGDWEGDTVIGAKQQGAIVSYVDRCSKYTILQVIDQKLADLVTQVTIEAFNKLSFPVNTITYDNGKEFSNHATIATALKANIYFARPYHSWERGLNEHTNGLLRQYLPKGTSFKGLSNTEVQNIAAKLNNRPRKSLGYQTPMEFITEKCRRQEGTVFIPDS